MKLDKAGNINFGAWLRMKREGLGMNKTQFGDLIGITRTQIRNLERNDCSPHLITLINIGKRLKIEAWQMIREATELERGI